MRRNIAWVTASVALVALLIGYQLAYAGTQSDDSRDTNSVCATATATVAAQPTAAGSATTSATAAATAQPAANACQPTGTDTTGTDTTRTGGDTSVHVDKPGENK